MNAYCLFLGLTLINRYVESFLFSVLNMGIVFLGFFCIESILICTSEKNDMKYLYMAPLTISTYG